MLGRQSAPSCDSAMVLILFPGISILASRIAVSIGLTVSTWAIFHSRPFGHRGKAALPLSVGPKLGIGHCQVN